MEVENKKKDNQNLEEQEIEVSKNFDDIEADKNESKDKKKQGKNNKENKAGDDGMDIEDKKTSLKDISGEESESEKEIMNEKVKEQEEFVKQLENEETSQDQSKQQEKEQPVKKKKDEKDQEKIDEEQERMDKIDQKMKSLLKKAQQYTDFLIKRHQKRKVSVSTQRKKRGNWEDEEEEEKELIEDEDGHTQQNTYLQKQPSILKGGDLKSYQLLGLNWMISLYESRINGILADQMGLGKTIQTISLVGFLREVKKIKGPILVTGPKSVLGNWFNEFKKWLPQCQVVKLIATKEERGEILDKYISKGQFDVCLTSFEGIKICQQSLRKINWKYIIIDEAHKIKNEESQLSKIIRSFNTLNKLLLTGTPLQNNLHELWSLLNFILPELFKESDLFDEWFSANQQVTNKSADEVEKKNMEMIAQLHQILKPFMLRRTKDEVEKTIPPKKEIHLFIGLTNTQIGIYKKLLKKQNLTNDNDQQKKQYLNILMQLRKCCNHPYLFEGVEEEGLPVLGEHLIDVCGKLRVLDKLLNKLKKEKHQVLIFSQMTMLLDILEDYCNFRKYKYCRLDGSTDMVIRDEGIAAFTQPNSEKFIYLLSTRAGGLGLNLMTADTVILYDSDWNPQMDLQAMDRAHRIGQKNQVNVYRFISENTIEEKIVERQSIKLRWDNLVITSGKMNQKQKSMNKDELKNIIQHGAAKIFKAEEGGTYNDEEIDQLLQRGEDKTKEFNKNIADKLGIIENKENNEMNLGMQQINIYEFIGTDKDKEDEQILDEMLAREFEQQNENRSRRDKKNLNYNINQQFMMQMQTPSAIQSKNPVPRQIKIPEHQLYKKRERYQELLQKEEDFRIANIIKGKQVALKKEQEKRRQAMTRYNPMQSYQQSIQRKSEPENKSEQQLDKDEIEDIENCAEKPSWYQKLSEEEEKEKEELSETGFDNWLKLEYQYYIQGCERFGRDNLQQIQQHIKTKNLEEVTEYGKAFWERIEDLSEKERILKNIEKGENLINQRKAYTKLIKEKCDKYRNPKEELQFDSDQLYNKCKSKFFSFENDKFLVYLCYIHEYGNWKEIRKAIKNEHQFRFDTYFRSRSEQDLNKRMQSIMRMLEKERELFKQREDDMNHERMERRKREKEAKILLKQIQQTHNQQKLLSEQAIVIELEDDSPKNNNNKEKKVNENKKEKEEKKSNSNNGIEEEKKQEIKDDKEEQNEKEQDQKEQQDKKVDSTPKKEEKSKGSDEKSSTKKEDKLKQTNITNFFQNSSEKRKSQQNLSDEEPKTEKKNKI